MTPVRRHRLLRLCLGIVVSLVCLWLAVRDVSVSGVLKALTEARPLDLMVAIGFILLATILRAWRWKLLFHPRQDDLRVMRLWSIVLVGQTLNIALPGRLGELARIYLVGRGGVPKTHVLTSIGLEKVFDVLALLLTVMLISVLMVPPLWFEQVRTGLGLVVVLLVVVVFSMFLHKTRILRLLERVPRFSIGGHPVQLADGLRQAIDGLDSVRHGRNHVALQTLSVLVWGSAAAANHLTLTALGLDLPVEAALLILAALQLGTAVPSTPGKVGVFQYLCVLALTPFAVARDLALSYGILLHLVAYVPPVVLGTVYLARVFPELRSGGVIAG